MEKYPAYKDSGLEWLGEIPEHWDSLKINHFTQIVSDRNFPEEELLSVYRNFGVIKKSSRDDNHNKAGENLSNYKLVKPGYLVLNKMKTWQGSLGLSEYRGIVSPAYITCRLTRNNIIPKFLHYALRSKNYVFEYNKISYGVRTDQWDMRYEDFKNIPVYFPKREEQTAIANFLDHKTAQIDRFIQLKEKTIALLEERKAAIINQAVTKGLNPNVPMKDSGIEWLGEIPEHWEVKRLRYLGQCQNGISEGADYFGSGFPFVSYSDVYKNIELPSKVSGLAKSSVSDRRNYSVIEGDVFFTRTSETIDEIGFTSTCISTIENATFAGFLIRFRPKVNLLHKGFSKYYFRSLLHRAFFVKEMNIVIRASLSQELLKKLPVLIPDLKEQLEIAQFLDQKISGIVRIQEKAQKKIALMKEYRESLISSAVTGKIDIRNHPYAQRHVPASNF